MLHAVVITNPARHYFLSLLLSLNVDKLIFGLQTALEILFQTNRIFKNNDYRDLSELQIQGWVCQTRISLIVKMKISSRNCMLQSGIVKRCIFIVSADGNV